MSPDFVTATSLPANRSAFSAESETTIVRRFHARVRSSTRVAVVPTVGTTAVRSGWLEHSRFKACPKIGRSRPTSFVRLPGMATTTGLLASMPCRARNAEPSPPPTPDSTIGCPTKVQSTSNLEKKLGLERQKGKQMIDLRGQFLTALGMPGPNLGCDVLNRRNAQAPHTFGDTQRESRRIDCYNHGPASGVQPAATVSRSRPIKRGR